MFLAIYIARVRITVQAGDTTVIREGHGSGEGRGTSPGEVHDIALKAAETDATKRALATFGKPFGLELYRNGKRTPSVPIEAPLQPKLPASDVPPRLGFHPDDTTPIPRPSHYYGRRQRRLLLSDHRDGDLEKTEPDASAAPPVAPAAPIASPSKIDKSQLTIAEPKRIAIRRTSNSWPRNLVSSAGVNLPIRIICALRSHALSGSRSVMSLRCRFAEVIIDSSITGNEIAWWEGLKIMLWKLARSFWEQTRAASTGGQIVDAAAERHEID